jgi:hypothetical protein
MSSADFAHRNGLTSAFWQRMREAMSMRKWATLRQVPRLIFLSATELEDRAARREPGKMFPKNLIPKFRA